MKAQGWRKIAAATWGHPDDPQIYGDLEVDAGASVRTYLESPETFEPPLEAGGDSPIR